MKTKIKAFLKNFCFILIKKFSQNFKFTLAIWAEFSSLIVSCKTNYITSYKFARKFGLGLGYRH